MQRSLGRLVSAGSVLLAASIALAGTPLPNPPFSTGGFVPPTSFVLRQELAVGTILSRYAVSRTKCDAKAVTGLQLAYEPANPTKIAELQEAWTECNAKAVLKYVATRDKLLSKGTPPCLDQAGIDAIRAQIDARFPALAPIAYCDGDAAAPDPVTGLNIPDFKQEVDGEVSAARVVTRTAQRAAKCYILAVKYVLKFGGSLPPERLARIDACFLKASDAANAAMARLDQTQKLPSCLPLATAQSLVSQVIGVAGEFNDETYCASPSGAFVDGSDGR